MGHGQQVEKCHPKVPNWQAKKFMVKKIQGEIQNKKKKGEFYSLMNFK